MQPNATHTGSSGMKIYRLGLPVAGLLLCSALPATAQTVPADGGRLLASNCFQCHGTNGSDGSFDALAGDGQQDNFNKLKDMQRKSARSNIMIPHAAGYTDEELKAITTYFSKLPKP